MFQMKSVVHACLYISIFLSMSEETEILLPGPNISSTGACPPKVVISLRSNLSTVSYTSLSYKVVCCKLQNYSYCYKPHKNLEKLNDLQCCSQLHERSGWLTCDARNALRDVNNPEKKPFTLFVSYVVTNGTRYIGHSKMSQLDFRPRKIVCTRPSNFTTNLTTDNVILTWGMPPRMDCLNDFRFRVKYYPRPDNCSDKEDEDNVQTIEHTYIKGSSVTKFLKEIPLSSLKPRRTYLFELTCDVFGDKQSAAAVNEVRTPSKVPHERPKFFKPKNAYFSKRMNITLSWKARNVTCPSKWGSENDFIQLSIYSINTESQKKTNVTQKSKQTKSLSALSMKLEPSATRGIKLGSDSNHFVISNVDRYQSFKVLMAYCNDAGCGPKTTEVIEAEPKPSTPKPPPKKTQPSNKGKYIAIVVAIGVVLAILGALGYKFFIRRANRPQQDDENRPRMDLGVLVEDIGPSPGPPSERYASEENVRLDELSPMQLGEEKQSTLYIDTSTV